MLKILQARLNSMWTVNFLMFKLDLKRQMNQRSNCQRPFDHWKSKRVPEKHLFLLHWLSQSLWLCGSQETVENSSRDGNTRPPDLLLRNCMQVRKEQLEMDMEQQTGCTLGKVYIKDIYCHPAHLTYMQSTSYKMPGWMKYKLEWRLLGEISITSDMQMTPPFLQKVKRN